MADAMHKQFWNASAGLEPVPAQQGSNPQAERVIYWSVTTATTGVAQALLKFSDDSNNDQLV